ncbi:phenol hydroxylase subunit [Paraburkholderia xenovorans]
MHALTYVCADGFVKFAFSIGDADLYVELIPG